MDIVLTVTQQEYNLLNHALQTAPMPLVDSYPLMEKIQQQARIQLQPPPTQEDEEGE